MLLGDYAEALAAADKVKPLHPTAIIQIQALDYFYYEALTVAACYENASTNQQQAWRELLMAHREQLREWAENYPPTFADKHVLVSAEIARLEGRAFDAMQLYQQAIQSAHEHGFVQNEAVAYEVAARFYLASGFEAIADMYLRNARNCYDRWGALGNVKQLDELYPRLREQRDSASPTATIGTPVGQLDVETVVKASQALSSEIVIDTLTEKLNAARGGTCRGRAGSAHPPPGRRAADRSGGNHHWPRPGRGRRATGSHHDVRSPAICASLCDPDAGARGPG